MAEGKSKIDQAGLGKKVLAMREDLTCSEIADIINTKYLPAGMEPINAMTIARYCVAHGITDRRNNVTKKVKSFNSLEESYKVRDRVYRHCDKLDQIMDECKDDEEKLSELASISNAKLNALKTLQALNESVSKIQAEQLRVENVRRAVQVIINVLREFPEAYAEVMKRLREHQDYDLIRSL